jgi:predicted aspartyl protease
MHRHTLTLKSTNGLARQLVMPVVITLPGDSSKQITVNALWDTGASGTVITQNVVDRIGLLPVAKTKVNTASESNVVTDVYLVDFFLKHDVVIGGLSVTRGKLTGIDCLIGMDIIGLGDFSITNFNNSTCMTFGLPSAHEVDYVRVSKDKKAVKQSNADYMKKLRRK